MAEAIVNDNNDNWQVNMRTLNDCGIFLFNNKTMSDITFTFKENDDDGSEVLKLYAHSWILSMLSPVFYEISKNNFELSKEIPTSFSLYECFLEALRFIYTCECVLTVGNVYDIMTMAKEYSLEFLENDCFNFIVKSITIETASYYLDKSITCENIVLKEKLLQFIVQNLSSILKTKSFLNCEKQTLEVILKINEVELMAEVNIFNGVMKWAEAKCIENKMIVNGENKRRVLGDLVKELRFQMMTTSEFGYCVNQEKGLLTSNEVKDLLISISNKNLNNFELRNKERVKLIDLSKIKEKYILTTTECLYTHWTIYNTMRDPKERSKFRVNKIIYLTGIFTAKSQITQNVTIQILNEENVILFEKTKPSKEKDWTKFDVIPLQINPNCDYFININYENTNCEFSCRPQQTLPATQSKDGNIFYFTELSQLLIQLNFKSI